MNIYLSLTFKQSFKKITQQNTQLRNKVKNKIALFQNNPLHPSLRLHKLKGKLIENWSISIESNVRLIFVYVEDGILLIDIGTHDEVYR